MTTATSPAKSCRTAASSRPDNAAAFQVFARRLQQFSGGVVLKASLVEASASADDQQMAVQFGRRDRHGRPRREGRKSL